MTSSLLLDSRGPRRLAERYFFSYLGSGFAPVWTRTFQFECEAYAFEAARDLMRAEAKATSTRPLTMLVGVGPDEEGVRWIGSWRWAPHEERTL
jgi:hypothetical protein